MISLLPAALAAALGGQAAPADHNVILADAAQGVSIRYDFVSANVRFSAQLPADWWFHVAVDGDQDGRWGDGPDVGRTATHPTHDFKYARNSDGSLCAQYVLTSVPDHPEIIYASSFCDALPSRGSAEASPVDAQNRRTVVLTIPAQELFGDRQDAHLQVCFGHAGRVTCGFTYVLPRQAPGH